MFKYWHKVVAVPTAATSIGLTIYFINLWKNAHLLMQVPSEPPSPEEKEPASPPPASPKPKEETGDTEDKASEESKGDDSATQGGKGKSDATTSKDSSDTATNEKSDADSGNTDATTLTTIPVSGDGGNGEEVNENTLEKEIKKLILKINKDSKQWIGSPETVYHTFELHEVLTIGNKLLEQINKIASNPKPQPSS